MSGTSKWSNQYFTDRQNDFESSARSYPRKFPFALEKAKGSYVWDVEGNRYLDFLCGAGTLALGHNDDEVNKAMIRLLSEDAPLHTLDLTTPVKDKFVDTVISMLPEGLKERAKIQFCSPSGTDAVDAAIKLCKSATARGNVIAFSGGYHGMGHGALALTGNHNAKNKVANLMSGVQFMPYPYSYRCPFGLGGEEGTDAACAYFERMLKDPESGVTRPAAVILEAIQGEGGVIPAPASFLQTVRRVTEELSIPLILDEIQSGYGRSGKFFAHQYTGIRPDMITVAKGIGNGFPMGAVLISPEFKPVYGQLGTTFGGNHLACAAALAVLDVIEGEGLIENAAQVGAHLLEELKKLPQIKDVRGRGLMIGMEFEQPIKELRSRLLHEQKVFTGVSGTNVIRLLPPLCLTMDEADLFLERFEKVVSL